MMRTIDLTGKPHQINVQRKYKAVWIAAGEYMGERIEVKERSEAEAVAAWQRAAKTRSDRNGIQ